MKDIPDYVDDMDGILSQAQEVHSDLQLEWAFALVPWTPRDGEPLGLGIDGMTGLAATYVGVRTIGGTNLPLTRDLLDSIAGILWWRGYISCCLQVPDEMHLVDEYDPLPYVDVFMTPGPTRHVDEWQYAGTRVALSCEMDAADIEMSAPIIVCPTKPEGWPY